MQNVLSNQIPGANQQYTPMGKIIENVDVLKTTEVPMDGNIYYFPKREFAQQQGIGFKNRRKLV